MKKSFLLIVLCSFFVVANAQQSKEELQKKESDIRKEIAELSNSLIQIQKNKKASVAQVAAVQRKIAAREELINTINKQVRAMEETIYQNELEIYRLRKELDTLKQKYAQSIVFAYKNRSSYQYLNFLFSSTSFNDALKRVTYLKSYRQLRETQVNTILKTQEVLQAKIGSLNNSKKEQSAVLANQQSSLKDLEQDKKEKDLAVKELKGKEKEVMTQIKQKDKQRQEMKNAIAAVIKREQDEAKRLAKLEEDRKRKQKLEEDRIAKEKAKKEKADEIAANKPKPAEKKTTSTETTFVEKPKTQSRDYSPLESTDELKAISLKFENNRGRLPWPVSAGFVSIHFGSYIIPGSKIKGNCDGVEIAVPKGTSVKSVADGTVIYSGDIGAEQVVIVKHGKYLTTYSHLSSINVSKGQEVKAGTLLGKSGTDLDGEGVLLFMVTNDKNTNLNPESWLAGKR